MFNFSFFSITGLLYKKAGFQKIKMQTIRCLNTRAMSHSCEIKVSPHSRGEEMDSLARWEEYYAYTEEENNCLLTAIIAGNPLQLVFRISCSFNKPYCTLPLFLEVDFWNLLSPLTDFDPTQNLLIFFIIDLYSIFGLTLLLLIWIYLSKTLSKHVYIYILTNALIILPRWC